MQHVNTEILKENQNLRLELKELTSITETWLNSSNKVNQCINEQIPTQKIKFYELTNSLKIPPVLDIDEVPSNESQRNTTDPSFVVSDSSTTNYDSADESLVCSTPLISLKKLDGAEPVFGPKTIKSILKSKSTFKAKTLKGITINKPSSAPARGKSSSASKTNSAPAGNLKNMKMEDDPPLAIVMKELNELKLQISKKKSSYSRNKIAQQTFKAFSIFPFCIHRGYNDHHSNDCLYYPTCEICGSYDHDTHGHNMIISLRRGINPRNPQHVTKNYETCGSNVHTTSYHNDIEWFRKRETLQAKNDESYKASKNDSSSALRSKTPIKRYLSVAKNASMVDKVAMFSAETEDITTAGCCANILEVRVNTFRNAIGAHYLPHSSEYVAPPSIDVVRQWFPMIGYEEEVSAKGTLRKSLLPPRWSLPNGINIDYANIFWEDIIIKLKKKQWEKVVAYTRFLSLLIMHKMKEGYRDDEVTLYPTQVFSVNNWALKSNQPKEPPFTDHMLAICAADKPVVFKASKTSSKYKSVSQGTKPGAQTGHKKPLTSLKQPSMSNKEAIKGGSSMAPTDSKTGHSKRRKESSSAMDSNLS
ncbi:hypothetical protein Tco_0151494 [Tanacetum coccineum]